MYTLFPGPAYRIVTPRLVLRCWHPQDAPLLKASIDESLGHLQAWLPWAKQEPQELQAKIERLRMYRGEFDLGHDFTYGIFNREETRVLGSTGLHMRAGEGAREIGYWIHKDYLGRGLATETAKALCKVAFEVDRIDRIEIHCDPANTRSSRIPEKLGFKHEASLRRRAVTPQGQPRDTMIWTLLSDEYSRSPAAAIEIEAFDAMGRRIL